MVLGRQAFPINDEAPARGLVLLLPLHEEIEASGTLKRMKVWRHIAFITESKKSPSGAICPLMPTEA